MFEQENLQGWNKAIPRKKGSGQAVMQNVKKEHFPYFSLLLQDLPLQ